MNTKSKLLIVEDDDLNRKVYKSIFSKEFDAVLCKNDIEFYIALENDQFEIFLIDLSLGPGKDGIQLIKELRQTEKYKSTPIMVVTAYAFRKDEQVAMSAGATKFFRKPIESNLLVTAFKESLLSDL